jgi:hypothetical protein
MVTRPLAAAFRTSSFEHDACPGLRRFAWCKDLACDMRTRFCVQPFSHGNKPVNL